MKPAIIYFTKWGATRQYAEWIAEALPNIDLIDANRADPNPSPYDVIIIASRVFMGKIAANSFLASKWDILKDKKVYLLVVGVSPEGDKDSRTQYEMIPEHIRNGLAGYKKVTGVIDLDKLNLVLKKIFAAAVKKGTIKTGGLAKEEVAPVIEWLKSQA